MSAVLVTDLVSATPDMGERVYARQLARAMRRAGMDVVSVDGASEDADFAVTARRTLFSMALARFLRRGRPEAIVYLQRSSLTPSGIVRVWLLGMIAGAPVVPLVLQPYPLSGIARAVLRGLLPRRVMVVSEAHARQIRTLSPSTTAEVVPAAVDLTRFRPASQSERLRIRRALDLDTQVRVVLHVGHLKRSRNLSVLATLAEKTAVHVVMVASSSTQADEGVLAELERSGVRVVTGYVERIEDWYRCADVYVFPTRDESGSIAVPLSVLEALACGLPVATTPFGALPGLLSGVEGVVWVETDEKFASGVDLAFSSGASEVSRYALDWTAVAAHIVSYATGGTR